MMKSHTSQATDLEIRTSGAASVDLTDDRLIRGYAIKFNVLSEDLGGFRERILPEAVNRSLKSDVRALVDHDSGKIIGRTKSGTLSLKKDQTGLRVEIEPDMEISYARDIVRAVARGDVSGMSFAFMVIEQEWHEEKGKEPIRNILDMAISEVSIVVFPAYAQTDVQVAQRSLQAFKATQQPAYNWRTKWHEIQSGL